MEGVKRFSQRLVLRPRSRLLAQIYVFSAANRSYLAQYFGRCNGTHIKFMGVLYISQLKTTNKPNYKSLKEVSQTVSESFSPPQFLPTEIYKLAYA